MERLLASHGNAEAFLEAPAITDATLRASDGANLETLAVGANPMDVAFDGANVWVVNNGSGTANKY